MNSKAYTIGLDLGDRHHHACVLDASGEILAEEVSLGSNPKVTRSRGVREDASLASRLRGFA